jgi:hypothetical protein
MDIASKSISTILFLKRKEKKKTFYNGKRS